MGGSRGFLEGAWSPETWHRASNGYPCSLAWHEQDPRSVKETYQIPSFSIPFLAYPASKVSFSNLQCKKFTGAMSFWCSPASSSASRDSLCCFWHTRLLLDWIRQTPHISAPSNLHASLGFLRKTRGQKETTGAYMKTDSNIFKFTAKCSKSRDSSGGGTSQAWCSQVSDNVNFDTNLTHVFLTG